MPEVLKIAKILFWINLLPAIVAAVVIVLMTYFKIDALFLNQGRFQSGEPNTLYLFLLSSGVICEYVYYVQGRNDREHSSKLAWIYSIIVNIIFTSGYIYSFVSSKVYYVLIPMIYPATFLVLSIIAIKKIMETEKSIG